MTEAISSAQARGVRSHCHRHGRARWEGGRNPADGEPVVGDCHGSNRQCPAARVLNAERLGNGAGIRRRDLKGKQTAGYHQLRRRSSHGQRYQDGLEVPCAGTGSGTGDVEGRLVRSVGGPERDRRGGQGYTDATRRGSTARHSEPRHLRRHSQRIIEQLHHTYSSQSPSRCTRSRS